MQNNRNEVVTVAYTWNQATPLYNEAGEQQYQLAMRFIPGFGIKSHEVVLDVGSGTGKPTNEMAKSARKAIGIDISQEMIKRANYLNEHEYKRDNLEFYCQDAANFELNTKVDRVVSFSCLHWLSKDELQSFFIQVRKHVKEQNFINLVILTSDEHIIQAMHEVRNFDKWKEYFTNVKDLMNNYSKSDIQSILQEVGIPFAENSIQENSISPPGITIDVVKGQFKLWDYQQYYIPEDRREDYRNDLITHYLKLVGKNENEPLPTKFNMVMVNLSNIPVLTEEKQKQFSNASSVAKNSPIFSIERKTEDTKVRGEAAGSRYSFSKQ